MKIRNFKLKISISQKGFTLIEMVVVVGVLGVLLATVILLVNPFQDLKKARDAQRKHDLEQLRTAASTYYNDHNCFPQELDELTPTYIQKIPVDPLCTSANSAYCYVYQTNAEETCSQWAVFYAKLEMGGAVYSDSFAKISCPIYNACGFGPSYGATNYCIFAGSLDCAYLKGGIAFPTGYMPAEVRPTSTPEPTPIGEQCGGITKYSCSGFPSRCNRVPDSTGDYCGFTGCAGNECCENACELE